MEKWISLAHPLDISTPGFAGEAGFFREEKSCICKGRNSNSEKWTLANHHGTHIDCPYHFDDAGKKMSDYNDHEWIFSSPYFIGITAEKNQLISLNDYAFDSIPEKCDFLILKTHFEKERGSENYWKQNPGLAPEIGTWLREHRPNLKVIGFDFISLTAFQHRALGKEAHLAFLSPTNGHEGIRIIEDMKLASLMTTPSFAIVSPLMVTNADGGPVNVWVKI